MTDVIYWAKLTEVAAIAAKFPKTDETLMILERLPLTWLGPAMQKEGLRFEYFEPTEPFDQWERGRIFNPRAELRWEKIEADFHLMYVGVEAPLTRNLNRDESLNLAEAIQESRSYYLWGQKLRMDDLEAIGQARTVHLYLELQIARLLNYPIASHKRRVKLNLIEYLHPLTKEPLYHRYQGVEAA